MVKYGIHYYFQIFIGLKGKDLGPFDISLFNLFIYFPIKNLFIV